MYAKLFAETTHLLALPIAALLLFVAIFAMVVVQTMRRKAAHYARVAALPLTKERDDE